MPTHILLLYVAHYFWSQMQAAREVFAALPALYETEHVLGKAPSTLLLQCHNKFSGTRVNTQLGQRLLQVQRKFSSIQASLHCVLLAKDSRVEKTRTLSAWKIHSHAHKCSHSQGNQFGSTLRHMKWPVSKKYLWHAKNQMLSHTKRKKMGPQVTLRWNTTQ